MNGFMELSVFLNLIQKQKTSNYEQDVTRIALYTAESAQRYRDNMLNPNDAFLSPYFWNLIELVIRKMICKPSRSFLANQNLEATHHAADDLIQDLEHSINELKGFLGFSDRQIQRHEGTDSYHQERDERVKTLFTNDDDLTTSLRKPSNKVSRVMT